jgi:hypothetical protein
VENLVLSADKYGLDIVGFDFVPISEKDRDCEANRRHELNAEKIMTGADYFCSACEHETYVPFACSALYNREYLKRRSICFINEIFYEDRAFMFSALTEADRVIHLEGSLYFTGRSRGLPLRKYFLRVYSYFVIYQEILQKCRSFPHYDERLQKSAAGELKAVCACLQDLYCAVNKKEDCRSRFSATELNLFDKLVDHESDFCHHSN